MPNITKILLILVCAALSACTATNGTLINESKPTDIDIFEQFDIYSPVYELAKDDILQSRSIGAVIGSYDSLHLCYKKIADKQINPTIKLILITACTQVSSPFPMDYRDGAVDFQRLEYSSEYDFLTAEISAAEKALFVRKTQYIKTQQTIQSLLVTTLRLHSTEQSDDAKMEKAKSLSLQVFVELEKNQILEDRYSDIIDYYDFLLDDSSDVIVELNAKKQLTQEAHQNLVSKRNVLYSQWHLTQTQAEALATLSSLLTNMLQPLEKQGKKDLLVCAN